VRRGGDLRRRANICIAIVNSGPNDVNGVSQAGTRSKGGVTREKDPPAVGPIGFGDPTVGEDGRGPRQGVPRGVGPAKKRSKHQVK